MALVIKFSKVGRKGESKYRIIVKEKRSKREGKPVDTIGFIEKNKSGTNKKINKEKLNHWVSVGASITPSVKKYL
ncbi:30S ribosomal protein S16 [Candidatus Parcubacteria bacterium]|nr:MAG: 30S ribosomal protein S16 [Candidatus Parcubacteria bacterium]